MKISMDSLCLLFAKSFDIIEAEFVGVTQHHSLRIASLCARMGKLAGYGDDSLQALITCALFHDNALTEYALNKGEDKYKGIDLRMHCEYGQRNISWLPFAKSVDGYVLHHHSSENGKGPFGVREFPHEAALIGAADLTDITHHLQTVKPSELNAVKDSIAAKIGTFSTKKAVESLLAILDGEMLESLHDENIRATMRQEYPAWDAQMEDESVLRLSRFISHIIDCKSIFTRKHSEQIANRAWIMGEYYGYTRGDNAKLYLAASLHDIGKIATPTAVLEKPGKLDKDEYRTIMEHVRYTYDWLGEVEGLGDIRLWAANHHEKLDGSGYPFGRRGDDLDFNSRLMACLDIYQAVCEERPYHPARSHEDTMPILYSMSERGLIDGKIVKDLDEVMEKYSLLPPPGPTPQQ